MRALEEKLRDASRYLPEGKVRDMNEHWKKFRVPFSKDKTENGKTVIWIRKTFDVDNSTFGNLLTLMKKACYLIIFESVD